MVKADYALNLLVLVRHLRQLCLQERLLGGQHFQIVRVAVLHQQLRAAYSRLQRLHFPAVQFQTFPRRLPLRQGVVHLRPGVQQLLPESDQRFLLLCLGDLQVGHVTPPVEERLYQRADRIEQPVARIDDTRPRTVGPSRRAAQRNLGIE